ncbi:MAG TPA: GTPase [Thermaerobacter sp.]
MRTALIIGQVNAGKTLFLLNFARYLGLRRAEMTVQAVAGGTYARPCDLEADRAVLVSDEPHTTRCLQSLAVSLPARKRARAVLLTDSTGLLDGIDEDRQVRLAVAQTLRALRLADAVLHVIDADRVGREGRAAIAEVERQVARYLPLRSPYAILANKMDLPHAARGLATIRGEFRGRTVLPISALRQTGFREVRRFVARYV